MKAYSADPLDLRRFLYTPHLHIAEGDPRGKILQFEDKTSLETFLEETLSYGLDNQLCFSSRVNFISACMKIGKNFGEEVEKYVNLEKKLETFERTEIQRTISIIKQLLSFQKITQVNTLMMDDLERNIVELFFKINDRELLSQSLELILFIYSLKIESRLVSKSHIDFLMNTWRTLINLMMDKFPEENNLSNKASIMSFKNLLLFTKTIKENDCFEYVNETFLEGDRNEKLKEMLQTTDTDDNLVTFMINRWIGILQICSPEEYLYINSVMALIHLSRPRVFAKKKEKKLGLELIDILLEQEQVFSEDTRSLVLKSYVLNSNSVRMNKYIHISKYGFKLENIFLEAICLMTEQEMRFPKERSAKNIVLNLIINTSNKIDKYLMLYSIWGHLTEMKTNLPNSIKYNINKKKQSNLDLKEALSLYENIGNQLMIFFRGYYNEKNTEFGLKLLRLMIKSTSDKFTWTENQILDVFRYFEEMIKNTTVESQGASKIFSLNSLDIFDYFQMLCLSRDVETEIPSIINMKYPSLDSSLSSLDKPNPCLIILFLWKFYSSTSGSALYRFLGSNSEAKLKILAPCLNYMRDSNYPALSGLYHSMTTLSYFDGIAHILTYIIQSYKSPFMPSWFGDPNKYSIKQIYIELEENLVVERNYLIELSQIECEAKNFIIELTLDKNIIYFQDYLFEFNRRNRPSNLPADEWAFKCWLLSLSPINPKLTSVTITKKLYDYLFSSKRKCDSIVKFMIEKLKYCFDQITEENIFYEILMMETNSSKENLNFFLGQRNAFKTYYQHAEAVVQIKLLLLMMSSNNFPKDSLDDDDILVGNIFDIHDKMCLTYDLPNDLILKYNLLMIFFKKKYEKSNIKNKKFSKNIFGFQYFIKTKINKNYDVFLYQDSFKARIDLFFKIDKYNIEDIESFIQLLDATEEIKDKAIGVEGFTADILQFLWNTENEAFEKKLIDLIIILFKRTDANGVLTSFFGKKISFSLRKTFALATLKTIIKIVLENRMIPIPIGSHFELFRLISTKYLSENDFFSVCANYLDYISKNFDKSLEVYTDDNLSIIDYSYLKENPEYYFIIFLEGILTVNKKIENFDSLINHINWAENMKNYNLEQNTLLNLITNAKPFLKDLSKFYNTEKKNEILKFIFSKAMIISKKEAFLTNNNQLLQIFKFSYKYEYQYGVQKEFFISIDELLKLVNIEEFPNRNSDIPRALIKQIFIAAFGLMQNEEFFETELLLKILKIIASFGQEANFDNVEKIIKQQKITLRHKNIQANVLEFLANTGNYWEDKENFLKNILSEEKKQAIINKEGYRLLDYLLELGLKFSNENDQGYNIAFDILLALINEFEYVRLFISQDIRIFNIIITPEQLVTSLPLIKEISNTFLNPRDYVKELLKRYHRLFIGGKLHYAKKILKVLREVLLALNEYTWMEHISGAVLDKFANNLKYTVSSNPSEILDNCKVIKKFIGTYIISKNQNEWKLLNFSKKQVFALFNQIPLEKEFLSIIGSESFFYEDNKREFNQRLQTEFPSEGLVENREYYKPSGKDKNTRCLEPDFLNKIIVILKGIPKNTGKTHKKEEKIKNFEEKIIFDDSFESVKNPKTTDGHQKLLTLFSEKAAKSDILNNYDGEEEESKSEFSEEEVMEYEKRDTYALLSGLDFERADYQESKRVYLKLMEELSILAFQKENDILVEESYKKIDELKKKAIESVEISEEISEGEILNLSNIYKYFQDPSTKSKIPLNSDENKILAKNKKVKKKSGLKEYLNSYGSIPKNPAFFDLKKIIKEDDILPYKSIFTVFPFISDKYIYSLVSRFFINTDYTRPLINLCHYRAQRLSVFNFIKIFLCLKNYDESRVESYLKELEVKFSLGISFEQKVHISDILGMFLINIIYFIRSLVDDELPEEFHSEKLMWPGREPLPDFLEEITSSYEFKSKSITEILLDFFLEFAPRKKFHDQTASLQHREDFIYKVLQYSNQQHEQAREVPNSIKKKSCNLIVRTMLTEQITLKLDYLKYISLDYYLEMIKETFKMGSALYKQFFLGDIQNAIINLRIDDLLDDQLEIKIFLQNFQYFLQKKAKIIDLSAEELLINMSRTAKLLLGYENIKLVQIFFSKKYGLDLIEVKRKFYSELIKAIDEEFQEFITVLLNNIRIAKALILKLNEKIFNEQGSGEINKNLYNQIIILPALTLKLMIELALIRLKYNDFVLEKNENSSSKIELKKFLSVLILDKNRSLELKTLALLEKDSSVLNQTGMRYEKILKEDILSLAESRSFFDIIDITLNHGCELYEFIIKNEEMAENFSLFYGMRKIFTHPLYKYKIKLNLLLSFIRKTTKEELKTQYKKGAYYETEISLKANRKCLFEDLAIQVFSREVPFFIIYSIDVNFFQEEGIDGGGLSREMFSLVFKEICDPRNGLFKLSENSTYLTPNPFSSCVPDHLKVFELIGLFLAKSILNKFDVQIDFGRPFLKLLCGERVSIHDLEHIEPSLTKNLFWLLENDIGDGTDLNIYFSHHMEYLGLHKVYDLKENGKDIIVNEENKIEYIKLLCKFLMIDIIEPQTRSLIKGLKSGLLPKNYILLEWRALGTLLSGDVMIDVKEMKKHCIYKGFSEKNVQIEWFWQILSEFDAQQKSDFYFFISGSFKPPLDGYKNNPIYVNRIEGENLLPNAHTCSFQIDLSNYSDKEVMRERLIYAMKEGSEGYYIS